MIAQLVIIVITALGSVIWHSTLAGIAIGYGGMISMINNLLMIRITHRQQCIKPLSASVGLGLLIYSVISRMLAVAILVYIGFLLNLSAFEMIVGLIIGQITLIIDTLVTQGINDGSR